MQIYLPIAELSVNIFLLLGIGGGVGFLSGLFGVGGGFLMTPLLIFIGVPPAVAVATQANQVVASSVSGVLAHWSRDNVDFKMGFVLLAGGMLGSTVGVGPVQPAEPFRPGRSRHQPVLCLLPGLHRHPDVLGKHARHPGARAGAARR